MAELGASHEHILGRAEKTHEPLEQREGGIAFKLPYGEDEYNITLDEPDLNFLLARGLYKVLKNDALSGFDATVELENPDLPLFVGTRSIEVKPTPYARHVVGMEVSVVTQSVVYEHRGILSVERDTTNEWSVRSYKAEPPLKES